MKKRQSSSKIGLKGIKEEPTQPSVTRIGGASGVKINEPVEVERKPPRRGFAKIDLVDVILSEEGDRESKSKPNIIEQITENAMRHKVAGTEGGKSLTYEPTYRQAPKKRFDADVVTAVLQELLEKELRELSYSERECINAVKRVAYCVRKAVKALYYDRYRLVVQVRIVEKLNQGMEARIGFLWDDKSDSFACYSMETNSLAAYAVVYAIYKE